MALWRCAVVPVTLPLDTAWQAPMDTVDCSISVPFQIHFLTWTVWGSFSNWTLTPKWTVFSPVLVDAPPSASSSAFRTNTSFGSFQPSFSLSHYPTTLSTCTWYSPSWYIPSIPIILYQVLSWNTEQRSCQCSPAALLFISSPSCQFLGAPGRNFGWDCDWNRLISATMSYNRLDPGQLFLLFRGATRRIVAPVRCILRGLS